VQLVPYATLMDNASGAPHNGQGEPHSRSALVEHITPEFADAAARMLAAGDVFFFQIRSVGGAVSDVPADATAYAHRSARFSVVALGSDASSLDRAWAELATHSVGSYLSFETRLGETSVGGAFPTETLTRLRALKRRLDPDNVFRDNFNIT
jgi:FAD/FMN-containing dehydrogenase